MSPAPVVIKLGGSLLDWPELSERLREDLDRRRIERPVLIVGGGGAADLIRGLDKVHGLGEQRSHQLALRALDLTAWILASVLPNSTVIDQSSELPSVWERGRIPVLAPRRFLELDEQSPDPLPHHWDVTTDSIAARIAVRLGASALVLLKSTDPPACWGESLEAASKLGFVDPAFPDLARGLRLVIARNLRSLEGAERVWEPRPVRPFEVQTAQGRPSPE